MLTDKLTKMNICILPGSVRPERQSYRLAIYLKNQLSEKGIMAINLADLSDYPLPVFGYPLSDEYKTNLETISQIIKEADIVIIVTPEYHCNISAVLKNILEYCGRELSGKVIGIAAASAAKTGGINACNALQITLSNFGVYISPTRLMVPEIHAAFTSDNIPSNPVLTEKIDKFLADLLKFAAMVPVGM